MATYAGPSSWSDKTRRLTEKRDQLRDSVAKTKDEKDWNRVRMFGPSKKQLDAEEAAMNHMMNVKESMAEDVEQQIADEYPKGTTVFDRKSRNKAEYGKPKQYAAGGPVKRGRGDGCAQRGLTKGKVV